MAVTLEKLKSQNQDYLLAHWEEGAMVMEPHCFCGNPLDDDYFCKKCNRECDCNVIVCADGQSFTIAQKLVLGNPNFRDHLVSMLDK